jgi:AcrR family transcriptional regulator
MNDNSNTINNNSEQGRGARRRARTRADLLAAARKVFAQRGYHDASIADITQMADVGVGTFYLHFRDKDDLFSTLLVEGLQAIREQISADVQRAAPDHNTFPVAIRAILRHAYEQRDLLQIALSGEKRLSQTFQAQSGMIDGFAFTFRMAKARGGLEGFDIDILARLVTGVVTQAIVWWFEQDEPTPDEMAEQVLLLLRWGLPAQLLEE